MSSQVELKAGVLGGCTAHSVLQTFSAKVKPVASDGV